MKGDDHIQIARVGSQCITIGKLPDRICRFDPVKPRGQHFESLGRPIACQRMNCLT